MDRPDIHAILKLCMRWVRPESPRRKNPSVRQITYQAESMIQDLLRGCRFTEGHSGVRRWLASCDYIEGNTRDQIEKNDAQLEKSHTGIMNGIKTLNR